MNREPFIPCIYCGGDPLEPDHHLRCPGPLFGRPRGDDEGGEEEIPRHRDSSHVAFYNAVNSGMVKLRKQQIHVALTALGISTQNEVISYLRKHYGVTAQERSFTPRFAEMRDRGYIRELPERACQITGNWCLTYQAIPLEEFVDPHIIPDRCDECHQIVRRTKKKKPVTH